jgi:phosphatidylglycerophosphate synthase
MSSYRQTLAEIRQRGQRKTGNLYDTYFTRRVSAFLTAALVPMKVSPNAVSVANIAVGAAACLLFAWAPSPWAAFGTVLVHLYAVLDSVDGELARYFRRPSLEGMFLENWSAYLMINGFFLAIGSYLWRRGEGVWPLALAVVVVALGRNAVPVARRTVLEVIERNPAFARTQVSTADLEGRSPQGGLPTWAGRLRVFLEESLLYQTNVWIVLSTLVLVEELVGRAGRPLVLVAFVFYCIGYLAKEAGAVLLSIATPHLRRQLAVLIRARESGEDRPAGE